jgi:GNAT superfamily N-acetyltransferase
VNIEPWGRDRLAAVMTVVDAALPNEGLSEDDLAANLFDDPDPIHVGGAASGEGFAGTVVRTTMGRPIAHVQAIAVTPQAQRHGIGRALLQDAQRWAFEEHGAAAVVAGGGAPYYLWPGVDVHATGAQCLFEAMGYRPQRAYLDLSYPSRFRAPVPAGIEVRRVLSDEDAERTSAFVKRVWPNWVAECRRGIEHGSCHIAISEADGGVVGFGCHSVNRVGVLGPIGTDPGRQHGGVGAALMSAISVDVMAAGFDEVQVSWIGPFGFYAKTAGATTSRTYLNLVLAAPGSSA